MIVRVSAEPIRLRGFGFRFFTSPSHPVDVCGSFPPATRTMEPPCLPGYRLLRHLGGGRLFHVWEARPAGSETSIVVKLPRPDALENPSTLVLLRREARAGRLVKHPRLVRILESSITEPPFFLAMEFVPGETVKDRLRRFGRFSTRRAVRTARQVAEALAAMHRVGLIHADVKPGNILVRESGEAKLVDLGFCHRRGENRKLIAAGFTIGTANYLAPELCLTPVIEGPPADVFALGATLFEMLTGRVPYPAKSVKEAIGLRKRRRALDLSDYRGNWPPKLVPVVRAMLGREPFERPMAAELVGELSHLETEFPLSRPSRPIRSRLAG